jgi:hypothetical protein
MPEDSQDKQLVIKYFEKKGIEARLFPKTCTMLNPDLKLYFDGNLIAYCELKSIMPYELELPSNFPSGQIYQDVHNDPAFNSIQNKIHEASKQLRSVNPDHDLPNIVFFLNHYKYRGIQDLRWVIKGQPSEKAPDVFDMTYLKRLLEKDDLSVVDYIIWIDSFSDKAFYYVRSESPFRDILKQRISSKAWEVLPEALI